MERRFAVCIFLAAALSLGLPQGAVAPKGTAPPAGYSGDPHFVGARGTRFDFNGALGKSFCLFADKALHVNALIDGFLPEGAAKPRSWIKEMAILWKGPDSRQHQVVMGVRRGRDHKRGQQGFISKFETDGTQRSVPHMVGETVVADGGFELKMLKNTDTIHGLDRDVFNIHIDGVLDAELAVNPEAPSNWAQDDAEVHFNLRVADIKVTPAVHGILGQTFRPDRTRVVRALKFQALSKILHRNVEADRATGAGFLDGTTADYVTSSLTAPDCKFAMWTAV